MRLWGILIHHIKMLFMPIRIQVTGVMHGPELPNTIHLLGKDVVLKRLGE